MKKIKILSNNLINKIAAGEVVERPVSVIKELVENSIDANSKKISIHIRNGGKTEIKVIDDGDGIRSDELELSVKRHATSKLNSGNLNNISTLGFRGEALPSIASISEMTISSNVNSDLVGREITIFSGETKNLKPINQQKGTVITIKNLFFSTPARLKFLKSDNYESLLIKRMTQKFALSFLDIEFDLFVNRKNILNLRNDYLASEDKLRKRASEILGKEFAENSVKLDQIRDNFEFGGLLGLPTFHHSNTNNQFVFVNNRVVSDKSISSIFKVAYRDFISWDRFPQLILFIKCPTDEVDINVHPAKSEVRFKDINKLRSIIISSFRTTISSAGYRASSTNTLKAVEKFSLNQKFKNNTNLRNYEAELKTHEIEPRFSSKKKDSQETPEIYNPLGYAKSQYHNTYIVSQTKSGIVIVDQHAAHERIVYEKLKKDFYNKSAKTQILLIPEIINIEKGVLENLKDKFEITEKYGLKIEQFGADSIIVREVPNILSECNIKKLVLNLIDELLDFDKSELLESQINKICSSMACHGSIRAGREMEVDEMNDLLRRMENTPFSGQCNHGRPTYIELDLNDIEKLFG